MADSQAALAEATSRLERALSLLEMRVRALRAQSETLGGRGEGEAFEQDRARLAEELDRARERGRALEEAAVEASLALSRAASDVRAVLNGEG
jgi:predicted  nucleic acid-binding Zn-ribbon protein